MESLKWNLRPPRPRTTSVEVEGESSWFQWNRTTFQPTNDLESTPLKFNGWNLRIRAPWKRKIIFQTIIFRFYVKLRGCIWLCIPVRPSRLFLTKNDGQVQLWIFFFWPPFTTTQKGKQYHLQLEGKVVHTSPFTDITISPNSFFLVRKSFQILSYLNLILSLFLPISIIQLMGRRQLLRLKTWTFHG